MQNFGFTEADWKFIDMKEKVSVIRWMTSIYQVYCGGGQDGEDSGESAGD